MVSATRGWCFVLVGTGLTLGACDLFTRHRFAAGDCFVTMWESGKPATSVTKVLGTAPNDSYILVDVVRTEGSTKTDSYTLTDDDSNHDEQRFRLRFQKVKCP